MRRTEEQKMGRQNKIFQTFGGWSCVFGSATPDVSKYHSAVIIRTKNCLILKVKALECFETPGTAGRKINVTLQRSGIFKNVTVRTSKPVRPEECFAVADDDRVASIQSISNFFFSNLLFFSLAGGWTVASTPQPGGPGDFWSRFSSSNPWYSSTKLRGSSAGFGSPRVFYFRGTRHIWWALPYPPPGEAPDGRLARVQLHMQQKQGV